MGWTWRCCKNALATWARLQRPPGAAHSLPPLWGLPAVETGLHTSRRRDLMPDASVAGAGGTRVAGAAGLLEEGLARLRPEGRTG